MLSTPGSPSIRRIGAVFASILGAAALSGCSVYDTSLLGAGGSPGTTSSDSGSSTTSAASMTTTSGMTCTSPAMCPGSDTECATRTCDGGQCGVQPEMSGKALANQTPADCKKDVCDGLGGTTVETDTSDKPSDGKECTTDACADSNPMFTNKPDKSPCVQDGGKYCLMGDCVECVDGADCASGNCTAQHTCGAATCTDMIKNGTESDTDCGGMCSKCPNGKHCGSATDCVSNSCSGTFCQPSCSDMMQNQDETDVDCGGTSCLGCDIAKNCTTNGDCASNNCGVNMKCSCATTHLVISEVRATGPAGGSDDFVELYNPTQSPISLSGYTVEARSSTAGSYGIRWTGGAQMLMPQHHFLIVGSSYSGAATVPADASLTTGIGDKGSVILKDPSATVIDALCYYYSTIPTNNFVGYTCEGVPFKKAADMASAERKLGGAMGNCTDTNDNSADFQSLVTSTEQNMASPATP